MGRSMNCPKCDADISESYEPDDYSVGISEGRYCDACDLAVAGWEHPPEPMEGDVDIFASTRGQTLTESTRCPHHPDAVPEMGFGLAGGGYGPYSYCPACGHVIHKTQEHG